MKQLEVIIDEGKVVEAIMKDKKYPIHPLSGVMAETYAIEDAFQIKPTSNGRIIRNLVLGAAFLQSHIFHFYQLAVVDYRLPEKINRVVGDNCKQALEIRKKIKGLLTLICGKVSPTATIVPGGVTVKVDRQKIIDIKVLLAQISDFIEKAYINDILALTETYQDYYHKGQGEKNMLSFGAFPLKESTLAFFYGSGAYQRGKYINLETDKGQGFEVGPLSRAIINKDQHFLSLASGKKAFSVMGRHVARAIEAFKIAEEMNNWLNQIVPDEAFCSPYSIPEEAEGQGLTDSPDGALSQWVRVEKKKITKNKYIVPTVPIDEILLGTTVKDPRQPIEVIRVVKSLGPYHGCTVHQISPDSKLSPIEVAN